MFMPTDEAARGLRELAADLRAKGASVFVAEHGEPVGGPAARRSRPVMPTPMRSA